MSGHTDDSTAAKRLECEKQHYSGTNKTTAASPPTGLDATMSGEPDGSVAAQRLEADKQHYSGTHQNTRESTRRRRNERRGRRRPTVRKTPMTRRKTINSSSKAIQRTHPVPKRKDVETEDTVSNDIMGPEDAADEGRGGNEEQGTSRTHEVVEQLQHVYERDEFTESSEADSVTEEDEEDEDYTVCSKRRRYTFVNRPRRAVREPVPRHEQRLELCDLSHNELSQVSCCSRMQCFHKTNPEHLSVKMRRILNMNAKNRRNALRGMMVNGAFMFDGRRVCSNFLVKAFRFSRDLQCVVKGTARANRRRVRMEEPNSHLAKPNSRDRIICFLNRLAQQTGNQMPDCQESHLPFYHKAQVYEIFKEQFALLCNTPAPSPSYFYTTWKEDVPLVKVRKVTKFTKCSTCEGFRDKLAEAARNRTETNAILRDRKRHHDFVARERRAYFMNQERAILTPDQAMSIIMDGADQSAFGLPHFTTITKDTRGHALKVKLIGLLQHDGQSRLNLYTMTENFETGANHVIETLHRFISSKMCGGTIPNELYVQVDNCTRENKNRFFFAYVESLVQWRVFMEVFVSFLPLGHTHSDIDQAFSRTAVRLRHNNAITLEDLHEQLRKAYTPTPSITHMKHVANISGLLQQEKCLVNVRPFSRYRYFRFYRTGSSEQDGDSTQVCTTCDVKMNCDDEWEPLAAEGRTPHIGGFIRSAPNLSRTPPTILECPSNRREVLKRLDTEQSRIENREKLRQLYALVEEVYNTSEDNFHWDLNTCAETQHQAFLNNVEEEILPVAQVVDNRIGGGDGAGELDYDVNCFVAVRPEDVTPESPFWVGSIASITKNDNDQVTALNIHWYERGGTGSVYDTLYWPSYHDASSKKKRRPWRDDISPDTVLVSFEALTKRRRLPARVCAKLRDIAALMNRRA